MIEPGLAFGTGDHPTTELCLRALEAFLASHPGASVLDVGTGSGILAIAAKKLGAGRVAATDNDPRAERRRRRTARATAWQLERVSLPTARDIRPRAGEHPGEHPGGAGARAGGPGGSGGTALSFRHSDGHRPISWCAPIAPWFRRVEQSTEGDWVLLTLSKEVEHGQG